MGMVIRAIVEKKPGFDWEARRLLADIRGFLRLSADEVRLFNVYDLENVDEQRLESGLYTVLSEPVSDHLWREQWPELPDGAAVFGYESLPGQFDQRADSCAQCLQMLWGGQPPLVRYLRVVAITGLPEGGIERVKAYLINPVDSRETTLDKPDTLAVRFDAPPPTPICHGFRALSREGLQDFLRDYDLAMDIDDLLCLRDYMRSENRDPTLAELRVIDTYWSDHCRHTTFLTQLTDVRIADPRAQAAYELYLSVNGGKTPTLMGVATAAMKALRRDGKLPGLDESDEVNACTVKIQVNADGRREDWLLLFKNETHNHPTEIEPFGGAATCIGGAIRDPLSGRSYVYQAMRVTGAADPRAPLADTIPGKLPQRVLTTTAAAGYSSYGNQIGLATGLVREIYHPGYAAKRMEIGAVVGAAPAAHIVREQPEPGDVVILIGGRTGRDGIGGATGSSKTHTADSVNACAAQVQKGNAPEERKLQRLFLDEQVTRRIKRCNDFGAGGIAVAIGELADGLHIDLSMVPKKYEGLGGTELAISESQERMAVVVRACDAPFILQKAAGENLEATVVATVTAEPRMRMEMDGVMIVDIARSFLNSNGAAKEAHAVVSDTRFIPATERAWDNGELTAAERWLLLAADLNFCSQQGLMQRFDGSVGAGNLLMPYGGKTRRTPAQVMAALLPAYGAETASVMSFDYDPYHMEADPFGGAAAAVVRSVAKLAAAGVSPDTVYLTLQEYFPRLERDATRWGWPLAALLGAFDAQMGLEIAAIGGKDSMSGSFEDLSVPPTLVSFAIGTAEGHDIAAPEFKSAGHPVYLLSAPERADGRADYAALKRLWTNAAAWLREGRAVAGWALETGGVSGGVIKMALGNEIGFVFDDGFTDLFISPAGALLLECTAPIEAEGLTLVGYTQEKPVIEDRRNSAPIASLAAAWQQPLEDVFPTRTPAQSGEPVRAITHVAAPAVFTGTPPGMPKAVIPAFPGTNSEIDTAAAVRRAGGRAEIVVIRNRKPEWLTESIRALHNAMSDAQMLILPGGFSGGDEPDGSAKFIVSLFRGERVTEATRALLHRDGLILGICNGFQALVKLGLATTGDISKIEESSPTLTYNKIGRHQAGYYYTRVASHRSPWLRLCQPGQVYAVPLSHGEGRFVAGASWLERLEQNGQIAQQYCDAAGQPSMDISVNPNGSDWAIESICSPDGRVLGKMGHTERAGENLAKNIHGTKHQPLFESGVGYFSN